MQFINDRPITYPEINHGVDFDVFDVPQFTVKDLMEHLEKIIEAGSKARSSRYNLNCIKKAIEDGLITPETELATQIHVSLADTFFLIGRRSVSARMNPEYCDD